MNKDLDKTFQEACKKHGELFFSLGIILMRIKKIIPLFVLSV